MNSLELCVFTIAVKWISTVAGNEPRVETPWNLICFNRTNNIYLSWLPQIDSNKPIDHYIVKIDVDKTFNHRTYYSNVETPYYKFEGFDSNVEYTFSVRAQFIDGINSSTSESIVFPQDCIDEKIIYAHVEENAVFHWKLGSGMTFNPVRKRETRPRNQAAFTIDTFRDRLQNNMSEAYKERIVLSKNVPSSAVSFTLKKVVTADGGYYMSNDFLNHTLITGGQLLVVTAKPSTPQVNLNGTAINGRPLELKCDSESNSIPEYHGLEMLYFWKVNGSNITSADSQNYFLNKGSLVIKEVEKSDNITNYTCYSTEEFGLNSDRSEPVIINVLYGPDSIDITPTNTSYVIKEFETLSQIVCTSDCNPQCDIKWEKFNASSKTYEEIPKKKTLYIANVSRFDDGKYRCIVENPDKGLQKNLTKEVNLSVQYGAEITDIFTSGNKSSVNLTFTFSENELINLTCKAVGKPQPDIQWKKDNITLENISSTNELNVIRTAACEKTGIYMCIAKNNIGKMDSKSVHIFVKCQPRLLTDIYPSKFGVLQGEEVVFQITVVANPKPSVRLSNETANTSVVMLNSFTYNITIRFNATEQSYKIHTLVLENDVGNPKVVTFTVKKKGIPVKPTSFKVEQKSDKCLQLSWTSKFNGGEEQIFLLRYSKDETNWMNITIVDPGEDMNVTHCISEFIQGVQYIFELSSKNSIGSTDPIRKTIQTSDIPEKQGQQSSINLPVYLGIAGGVIALLVLVLIIVIVLIKKRKGNNDKIPHARTNEGEYDYANVNANPLIHFDGDSQPSGEITEVEYAQVNKPQKTKHSKFDNGDKSPSTIEKSNIDMASDGDKTTQHSNSDGMIYLDVEVGGSTQQSKIIHGDEDRTEYTFVDFNKTAEIRNDTSNADL